MNKEELQFMFNHGYNGFYLREDIRIGVEKKKHKKIFTLLDTNADKLIEFDNIDDLLNYKIDNKTVRSIIEKQNKLNIDGVF